MISEENEERLIELLGIIANSLDDIQSELSEIRKKLRY